MQGAFLHTAGVLENLLTRLLYVIFQLLFLLITDVLRHDTFDQSSGGDDHPSANQFLFMYRILPVSSLIKSPKRASVQTEPSRILLSMQSAPTSRTSGMAAIHSACLKNSAHQKSTSCRVQISSVLCLLTVATAQQTKTI
jgi:hypothetical protein